MSWIINVGIGLLILPSVLVIIIPLINSFFNSEFLSNFDFVLSGLNTVIGSNNVNYMLQIFSIILFFIVFRWIVRAISNFK